MKATLQLRYASLFAISVFRDITLGRFAFLGSHFQKFKPGSLRNLAQSAINRVVVDMDLLKSN